MTRNLLRETWASFDQTDLRSLETWLRQQHAKLSRRSKTAKAIDYSLKRWTALTRFLDDGRLCIQQRGRACRARRNDRFILHLLFKCLETLRSVFRNRADPGAFAARPGGSAGLRCQLLSDTTDVQTHAALSTPGDQQASAAPKSPTPP
jgi:hypothetical protein